MFQNSYRLLHKCFINSSAAQKEQNFIYRLIRRVVKTVHNTFTIFDNVPDPTTNISGTSTTLPDCGSIPARSSAVAYRDGYSDCAREVATYLGRLDTVGLVARTRVLSHLSARLRSVNAASSSSSRHGDSRLSSSTAGHLLNPLALVNPSPMPTSSPYAVDRLGPMSDHISATARFRAVAATTSSVATEFAAPSRDWTAVMTPEMSSQHRHHVRTSVKVNSSPRQSISPSESYPKIVAGSRSIVDSSDDDGDDRREERRLSSTARTCVGNNANVVKQEVPTSSSSVYDLNGNNIDVASYDDDADSHSGCESGQTEEVWRPW